MRKLAGRISSIQALQLAYNKVRIAGPHSKKTVDQAIRLVGWQTLGIVRWRSDDDAVVRKDDDEGSVRRVEAHDDVAVTCQILSGRREVYGQGSGTSSHDHDWIGTLLRRDGRIRCAMGPGQRQIARKELTHQDAGVLRLGQPPWRGQLLDRCGRFRSRRRVPHPNHYLPLRS